MTVEARIHRIQSTLDMVQAKLDTVLAHIDWITGIYDHVRNSNRVFRSILPAREPEDVLLLQNDE